MPSDYFTVAEFREVTGDEEGPQERYHDTDITEAQEEVVEQLESWARTAWQPRTATETQLLRFGLFQSSYIPIRSVTTFTLAGTVQAASAYTLELAAGQLKFGDWQYGTPGLWPWQVGVLEYSYGFDTVPRLVKNAVIKATRSSLDTEEGRAKIPPNARRYSTERTDFDLESLVDDKVLPWPWDPVQSARMRAYWGRRRPRVLISV